MIDWLVGYALRKRLVVAMICVFVGLFGYYSWTQLAVEAYPDIADVSAQVITQAPGLAAEEVEQQVTIPLERELNGTPGLFRLRSISLFGLSMVVLWKYAFPRIGEALDRRQRAIELSIDEAEQIRRRADDLLSEYRERLTEARQQADEIIERARKAGEAHERESEEEAKARRERLMEQTRREIELETQRAIQDIRREVADLTVLATERVTRKVLTEEDQRRLVEETLSEIDFASLSPGSQN